MSIIQEDPFYIHPIAEYELIEFIPQNMQKNLKYLLIIVDCLKVIFNNMEYQYRSLI